MSLWAELVKNVGIFFWVVSTIVPLSTGPAFGADDPMCIFVSKKGTAWVVRRDSAVKVSLKVGDNLYQGDQVIVMRGNTVQLAFDKDLLNMVQVEGESILQLKSSNPFDIELYKGKVFAVIGKKGGVSDFKISTPAAIASVRGTQYQVIANEEGSKVLTYEGKVRVSGRENGKETDDFVVVSAGEKTKIVSPGKAPEPVQPMTNTEKKEIVPVLSDIKITRDNYQAYSEAAEEVAAKAKKTPSSSKSQIVKKDKPSDSGSEAKGNRIII